MLDNNAPPRALVVVHIRLTSLVTNRGLVLVLACACSTRGCPLCRSVDPATSESDTSDLGLTAVRRTSSIPRQGNNSKGVFFSASVTAKQATKRLLSKWLTV